MMIGDECWHVCTNGIDKMKVWEASGWWFVALKGWIKGYTTPAKVTKLKHPGGHGQGLIE